jgi:DNA (cytosine-5)-methyltransferase 1
MEPSHPLGKRHLVTVQQAWQGVDNQMFGAEVKGKTLEILKQCKQGWEFPDVIGRRSNFSFIRLHYDKPSNSLPKSTSLAGYCYLFHPVENRGASLEEMKRLASYPDAFQFAGAFTEAHNRIGNSVPPLFMRAIAEHIKVNILG